MAGDKVLIGSYDAHLYALGAKDGKLSRGRCRPNGYVHATPAVVDGVAYIAGCDEILRAIRVSDGKELFTLSSGAYTGASPAILNGRAYYGTYENEVLAVDLKAHRVVWRYKHPERHFPFYSSAAIAGGRVIVGGRDKMVHAIDLKTGKAAWTFTTRARVDSSPVVAGESRLRRRQRRQALRAGRRDREERLRVRGRRPAVRVPSAGVRDGSSSARRTASCSAWVERRILYSLKSSCFGSGSQKLAMNPTR